MNSGAMAADAGRLSLMAGGDAAVLERRRDLFEIIAAQILHVGGSGAGHTMKLIWPKLRSGSGREYLGNLGP